MDDRQPTQSALDVFPPEIRLHIGSLLNKVRDARRLALVSSAWQDAGESVVWRSLKIVGGINTADDDSDAGAPTLGDRYKGLATALAARPTRATFVRHLTLVPDEGSEQPILAILAATAPYIVSLHTAVPYPEDKDHPYPTHGLAWYDRLLSDFSTLPPAPHLTKLIVMLGPHWAKTLRDVMHFAPNVEELRVIPGIPLTTQVDVDWPKLERLRVLGLEIVYEDTALLAAKYLEQFAPNLQTILLGDAFERKLDMGILRRIVRHPRLRVLVAGPGETPLELCQLLREDEKCGLGLEELHLSTIVGVPRERRSRHSRIGNMSHIADAQEFADWCVPLPKLRLITGECEEVALGEMMRQIQNAIEGGEPPEFIQHIGRCPALIQVRLGVHRRRSGSRTPGTRVKLDVFTSSNGIDTLCLLAFRVPVALYRERQAITPVTELLGFDPSARWNERRES